MRVLLLVWIGLFACGNAVAHDIGVTPAELVEYEDNRYELVVSAGPQMAYLISPPLLPEGFEFVGNPRGAQGTAGLTFEFSSDRKLIADDVLVLPWRRDGAIVSAVWGDGSRSKRLFKTEAGEIRVPLSDLQAGSGSWTAGARRYTMLGIEHILSGIDHLLFVLGLLWIVRGGMQLVKTITAFTVAHSITLGLATFGFVNLPPGPVEACIALSIVFLGVEILHARQGRPGLTYRFPWVVAFGFGLLHGLGFAGALSEIGLPQSEIPLALLFFNVGVEIGQLLFVLVFLALRWVVRKLPVTLPEPARAIPGYALGTVAALWFLERVTGMFF